MAPQTDEFGTKVGLLAGLVLVCAARPLIERLRAGAEVRGRPDAGVRRAAAAVGHRRAGARRGRVGLAAIAVVVVGAGIVVAGIPARGRRGAGLVRGAHPAADGDRSGDRCRRSPWATDVIEFDHTLDGAGMESVVVTLAQNLELENQALLEARRRDPGGGRPRRSPRRRCRRGWPTRRRWARRRVEHYQFDCIDARLIVPFGAQTGLSLGLDGRGHRDRGDVRRRRAAAVAGARRRSPRRSRCGGPPATAG